MERLIVVLDENMDGEISVLEFLAQVDPRYGNYSALGVGDVNADLSGAEIVLTITDPDGFRTFYHQ